MIIIAIVPVTANAAVAAVAIVLAVEALLRLGKEIAGD